MPTNVPHSVRPAAPRRASTMMVATALLMLAALFVMFEARTLLDHGNLNERRRADLRAFYTAESGISTVVHWINKPADYTPDPALFAMNPDNTFTTLVGLVETKGRLKLDETLLPELRAADGAFVGRVVELALEKTQPGDPTGSLFRVRSVGQAGSGRQRTVLMFATYNDVALDGAPAAIISKDAAAFGGNFEVHWGEVWGRGTVEPPSLSHAKKFVKDDPWIAYRSEADIDFPGESTWKKTKDWYAADATQPVLGSADYAADYGDKFFQNTSLDIPEYDYATYKEIAIRTGGYYSTDSSGNIYRDGIEDSTHKIVSFDDEFSVAGEVDAMPRFVFIDTIDGQPPAADGSNFANLKISGGGTQVKGLFYINGDLDMTGIGNPPPVLASDPDGNVHKIDKVFMNGLMFVKGAIFSRGNASAYGSLITEGGFDGSGTPDVYYNAELAEGLHFPVTSKIRVSLWKTY